MTLRGPDQRATAPGPRPAPRRQTLLRSTQGLVGLWLLVLPTVLPGPPRLIDVKDLVGGTVLLAVAIAAARSASARRLEAPACLGVGIALIVASAALSPGSGPEAAARQWNEVVVGVLLVCLWAARSR